MPRRRRIWCETVPHRELAEPRVAGLLRRFDVAPIVAVWPSTAMADVARALRCYADAGLPVALWPMLDDDDGRWVNTTNVRAFVVFASSLVDAALREGAPPPAEIVVDLEPSIDRIRPLVAALGTTPRDAFTSGAAAGAAAADRVRTPAIPVDRGAFATAREQLSLLGASLRTKNIRMSAAFAPMVLLDAAHDDSWQRALGTPVFGIAWDHASAMLYTSMIEGWSRGVLTRSDARAVLAVAADLAAVRFGDRAGASLGAVGTGALRDEPVYRDAGELADDVAVASAAGVDDLALFDLGGVLGRGDPEAWLHAFTATKRASCVPAPSLRVRAVLAGARAAARALGAASRLRRAP